MTEAAAGLCRHRRIVYPAPVGAQWKMACTCGWSTVVALGIFSKVTGKTVQDHLNRQFVAHLKPDERQAYVLVDQRPGCEGQWIMPEGIACTFDHWFEDGGIFFVDVDAPLRRRFPVGEVRTVNGQTLRAE